MKIRTSASILTGALWVLWLVPLQGKKLAPKFFDSSAIQWTSAIIVAILIPVVVLMALSMIFTGARPKLGFGIAFFACLPLFFSLTMFGIGGTMLARTNLIIQRAHQGDTEMISSLTDRAVSGDSVEKRARCAGLLYTMFAVQAVWKDEKGNLARYYPTVEEQQKWERTVDTSTIERKSTEMIDWQLKQIPWLFGLYLGSFAVIVGAGLAWRAYTTKSEQVVAPNGP